MVGRQWSRVRTDSRSAADRYSWIASHRRCWMTERFNGASYFFVSIGIQRRCRRAGWRGSLLQAMGPCGRVGARTAATRRALESGRARAKLNMVSGGRHEGSRSGGVEGWCSGELVTAGVGAGASPRSKPTSLASPRMNRVGCHQAVAKNCHGRQLSQ